MNKGMKSIRDYTNDKQSELFEELGVFFAFSEEQFKEGKEKTKHLLQGKKYSHLGAGMYIPSVNVEEFSKRHKKILQDAREQYLADYGASKIIQYELANYEIQYSYDGIRDPNFQDAIKGYGFTNEQLSEEYKKYIDYCADNNLI